MTGDPHHWAASLSGLHTQIWTLLIRGVHDRHAAARHPTLATVGLDGMPQVRTVVLRGADRQAGSLDIHTDINSSKINELRAFSGAALHVWDATAHLQLRLRADVGILTYPDVGAIWDKVPQASRQSYGSTPASGQPIEHALDYVKDADVACFAVLRFNVQSVDALHLGPNHRRARFDRLDGWQGQWLVP